MKRFKILCVLLSLMLVMTFTACSTSSRNNSSTDNTGNDGGTTGKQTSDNVKVDTIVMWSNDTHNQSVYEEAVKEFNNTIGKEKGIIVDYSVFGSDYYNTLDVAVTAGEGPDIFKCNKVGKYSEAGYIMAWDDIEGLKGLIDRFNVYNAPGYGIFGDKTYAVPLKVTNYGLACNLEIFRKNNLEVPKTWDEMREAARIITENGGGKIYGYALAMGYGSYNYFYVNLPNAATVGDEYFNHTTGRYDFLSLEGFFNHVLDIIKDGSMFPGYETMDGDTARAQFSAGNIGMIGVMSSDVATFENQFPVSFEYEVVPYPVKDAGNHYKYPTGVSLSYVINSQVAKKGVEDKVAEFLNYLYSDDIFVETYEKQLDIPIEGEKITSKAKTENLDPNWIRFADMNTFYIKYPNPDSDVAVVGETYQEVYNKILVGAVDVHNALADLTERYNKALDEAIASGKVNIDNYIDKNLEAKRAWGK